MVKQLISIAVIGGVGALSACFGDGPTPGAPDSAIVVFSSSPGQHCSAGTYIGPVAIGSDHGYVSFLPYQANGNGCNGGGGGPITAAQQVFSFGLHGEALTMIGSAGESNSGAHVQIAAAGSGAAWAYNDPGAGSNGDQVLVHPGTMTYGTNMGTEVPLGLVAIGSDLYLASENNAATTGGEDLENPEFPNGGNGTLNGAQGSIWKIGGGKVASWSPGCGGLDRCIVAGGSALVYVERPVTGGSVQWQITRYDVGSASPSPQTISSQMTGADFPFGLDADDHLVAWSTTQSCVFNMMSTNQHCEASECSISVFDTTMPQAAPKTLLATTQFGCLDAKLADGYVYFTIVGIYSDNNTMFGRGIGRVNIASRTIETLDLGIRGPYAGPRRIFPVGDQLFLVDPLVMARIPKSALDGKQDFTP